MNDINEFGGFDGSPEKTESTELPDLIEVVGVRFKVGGKIYYFDPIGMPFNKDENVIIDTSRGFEYGECAQGNHMVEASRVVQPLRPVVRRATEEDTQTLRENYEKEKNAFHICQQKILEHKLDMKLVGVEYSFDGSKILFFFTSDGRVDFRDLVKNLASVFRTRIELRQIGVRDEAKMLGGVGICGRQFCCSSFLDEFHPVSIKMAKTQNLSLNPTKISGACGRLMCCLKYEQHAYEDMHKRTPKVESLVETDKGQGTVTDVNLLKAQVKVRLDNEPETPKVYKVRDITVLRNGGKNKKEIPLLPPDPPILEDLPEEEKPETRLFNNYSIPQISYSDAAAPKNEASPAPEQKRRDRNRSRKKPAQQNENNTEQKNQPEKQGKAQNKQKGQQAEKQEQPKQGKKTDNRKNGQQIKQKNQQSDVQQPKQQQSKQQGQPKQAKQEPAPQVDKAVETKKSSRPRNRRYGRSKNQGKNTTPKAEQ